METVVTAVVADKVGWAAAVKVTAAVDKVGWVADKVEWSAVKVKAVAVVDKV